MAEFSRRITDRQKNAFEGFADLWNADIGAPTMRVLPGESRISADPDLALVTILGSCVAACIRDPVAGVGGMNHFLLPNGVEKSWKTASSSMRYGQFAMESLISDLIKKGAQRQRLEVKIFGGASVIESGISIGENNIKFIRSFLREERLNIAAEDVGGINARRIHYFPVVGKVLRLELKRATDQRIFVDENHYLDLVRRKKWAGEVELFEERPGESRTSKRPELPDNIV